MCQQQQAARDPQEVRHIIMTGVDSAFGFKYLLLVASGFVIRTQKTDSHSKFVDIPKVQDKTFSGIST